MRDSCDVLIIGGGIVGLAIARELKRSQHSLSITLIEKEDDVAMHASGRNSGVLHAGFYYSADSLKARLCVAGNRAMKDYCRAQDVTINECGKLVVAKEPKELQGLQELYKRGKKNGANVELISAAEALAIEPNIRTYEQALYSPDTATVNPEEVCAALKKELLALGVCISLKTAYQCKRNATVVTSRGEIRAGKVINCAGLYADKIAHDFGFGRDYTIIPFKGLYLKYTKNTTDIRTNIYPVPNLKNPFLGVHFTKLVDGSIKIGPTAIPAFWREHYVGLEKFDLGELLNIGINELRLFISNAFGFRNLAFEEMKKYNKTHFVKLATQLVREIDVNGFGEFTRPGIRAQLLNTRTQELVQDFVIESNHESIHILNAVSPCFTCSLPFAQYIVERYFDNSMGAACGH